MYCINPILRMQVFKIVVLSFMLAIMLPDNNSYAQANPQRVFVGVTFIKVRPGKQDQYQQLIEKYGKKINEYFYKKENLLGWYLYKILMPSGASVDYDYAAVNVVTSFSDLVDPPGSQKDLLKKVFPEMNDKMIADMMAKYDSARIVIRREVYMPVDGVQTGDTSNPVPAKYMEVDMMHPAAGKTDDYIKLEKETVMPLHAERIKSGYIRNWGLYEKVFADERSGFEFVTVNFYDNLDKLGGGYEEAMKKVMPQMNMNTLITQIVAARTMIRSEMWKLLYYVDRSNTKK
jgi:hypothetical protein